MYYGKVKNFKFTEEFKADLKKRGLVISFAPHAEGGERTGSSVLFLGVPENVKRAVEISHNPFIGKEKSRFEDEFWEWVEKNRSSISLTILHAASLRCACEKSLASHRVISLTR